MKTNKKITQKLSLTLSALILFVLCTVNITASAHCKNSTISKTFISEENLGQAMDSIVVPYISSFESTGYFTGQNNVNIFYKKYVLPNSKGNIVISHGFTEYVEKYNELIYYFLKEGYSVFIAEHRGHGRSGHLGKVDSTQVNVEDNEYYILDLKTFIDSVVKPNSKDKKLFLFGHSMGGGIAAKFAEEYPNYFSAVILTAPMLEIDTGSTNALVARSLANLMVNTGNGGKYVLGHGAFDGTYDFENSSTGSRARYDYTYNMVNNNAELQRGGASYSWLLQSFRLTDYAVNNACKIKSPVLLFQAENDTMVKPGGQNTFASKARNCELVKISGGQHNLFRESDDILLPYLQKVMSFYNSNL